MLMRIGESQLRHEDDTLLRGAGLFTGDEFAEDELAMAVVRSPFGAGRIRSLDTEAARAVAGVVAVLTGDDVAADGLGSFVPRLQPPAPGGGKMVVTPSPPLTRDRVRFVGDPVAVVIAESPRQAAIAADLVALDVESEDAVVDPAAAFAPGAPKVWDEVADGNVAFLVEQGDKEAVEAAFAGARHVIERRLAISRVAVVTMEPRTALAWFDEAEGRYHLRVGTQSAHRLREGLLPVLHAEADDIHVVTRQCGGSFGMRNNALAEYVLVLWAARRLARPVRWTSSRVEAFLSDPQGREQVADAALALDGDGHFLALRVSLVATLGAYFSPATTLPLLGNTGGLAGVYRTPAIQVTVRGMHMNTQSVAPYRGAGRPEATYIVERMIDLAAGELGLDRVEIRRRNMVTPDQMPFKTGLVFTYDSGDFPTVMDKTLEAADWAGFEQRRAEAGRRGRLRGIGISNPIEIAGGPPGKPFPEYARIEIDGGGRMVARIGSGDSGQGHVTSFRQILSERFGFDADDIEIVAGDTDEVEKATGTFGSRTMFIAGNALMVAADEIEREALSDAADALEAAGDDLVFESGGFAVAGTDRRISLAELAERRGRPYTADHMGSPDDATYPNGCQGGVVQGLGQAFGEQVIYEPGTGQLLTASFMDYAMPRAADLPGLDVSSHAVPTTKNALGAKGAGEAGVVGALAAGINAVCDALGPLGISHIDMPATPQRIWRAIRDARRAS